MFVRTVLALLILAVAVTGCARNPTKSLAFAESADQPYLLDSGDKLRVVVFGQETLSNSYTVDGGGNIAMPLIGVVKARGASVRQLEQTLERKLREGLYRNPDVTVDIEAYRPFFILGEVNNPGQYPYVNGMTAQTAVAIAGGFTAQAKRSSVEITRQLAGRAAHARVPPLHPIRPGDTINVEERFF
jgi:polysaccharide export outer membrane protein